MDKRRRRRTKESTAGFTLIEILLVVVIIGILAAVAVPRFAGRTGQAKVGAAKASIKAIGVALDMFEMDHGNYPQNLQELVRASGNTENWHGPYLKDGLPKDPWGNDFQYQRGQSSYVLKSGGPPGGPEISNTESGTTAGN
jgi:general secretion pathway protein G